MNLTHQISISTITIILSWILVIITLLPYTINRAKPLVLGAIALAITSFGVLII